MDSAGEYTGFTSLLEQDQQAGMQRAASLASAFADVANNGNVASKLNQDTQAQTGLISTINKNVQIASEQNRALLEVTKTGNKLLLDSLLKINQALTEHPLGDRSGSMGLIKDLLGGNSSSKSGRILNGAGRLLGSALAVVNGTNSFNELGQTRNTAFLGDQSTGGLLGSRAANYTGLALSGAEVGGAVGSLFGGVGAVPGAVIGGGLGLGAAAVQDYLPQIKDSAGQVIDTASAVGKNVWQSIEQSTSKGVAFIEHELKTQNAGNMVSSIASTIGQFVNNLASNAKDLLTGLFDWILSSIPSLNDIKQGVSAVGHGISSAASTVANVVSRAATSVGDAINRATGHDIPEVPNYRPGSSAGRGGLAADEIKRREQQSMDYFMKQGWSKEQAAGITANIKKESNFNENASGDGGHAYGLAQWHEDRQGTFNKWSGKDIKGSSFAEQLAHVQYELTHGEKAAGDRLKKTTTAREAGAAVSSGYERPADREGNEAERGASAEQYAKNYKPSQPDNTTNPNVASGTPNAPSDAATAATKASNEMPSMAANTAKAINPAGVGMASEHAGTSPDVGLDKSVGTYLNNADKIKQQVADARAKGYSDAKIASILGPGYDKDGNKTNDNFTSNPAFQAAKDRLNTAKAVTTPTAANANNSPIGAPTDNPVAVTPSVNDANTTANTATSAPTTGIASNSMASEHTGISPEIAQLDKNTGAYLSNADKIKQQVADAKAKGFSDDKIASILGPGYDKDGNKTNDNFANDPAFLASKDRINNQNYAKAMPPPNSVGNIAADSAAATDDNASAATSPASTTAPSIKPKKTASSQKAANSNYAAANQNSSNGLGINDIPMHISTGGLLMVNSGATA